jgi:hypothetical protein
LRAHAHTTNTHTHTHTQLLYLVLVHLRDTSSLRGHNNDCNGANAYELELSLASHVDGEHVELLLDKGFESSLLFVDQSHTQREESVFVSPGYTFAPVSVSVQGRMPHVGDVTEHSSSRKKHSKKKKKSKKKVDERKSTFAMLQPALAR